eukprot:TRINITY_DN76428_c0_g1_i1.p1 TRINITY_DN76428_c0_g1~~TRINITY_DN76428_c0_g1_i1.p1  ORF type:complete len:289 (+),score=68.51 TRINITY_DN76428_c0_g1_i1:97-963(+)
MPSCNKGVRPVTRTEILSRIRHPGDGMAGLRLMNNNHMSNGTGRDWMLFGDPGFHSGRKTPPPPDPSLPPRGDRPHIPGPLKINWGDGRRPLPNVPRAKDGSSIKPVPAVIRRWEKQASAPCFLDGMGFVAAEPPEGKAIVHYLTADEQKKLDSQFKPNMASYPFQKETFPVQKYRYYSDVNIAEAFEPKLPILDKPPALCSTYTEGMREGVSKCPPGHQPTISPYHNFSEDIVRQSPHFQTVTSKDGLSKPRKEWNTLQGRLNPSLAEARAARKSMSMPNVAANVTF